jgi:hypothetical protein
VILSDLGDSMVEARALLDGGKWLPQDHSLFLCTDNDTAVLFQVRGVILSDLDEAMVEVRALLDGGKSLPRGHPWFG